MKTDSQLPPKDSLFAGRGEVRAQCRAFDWSASPLGPSEGWPPSLRFAVRLCLGSRVPQSVWAGPDLVLIYNQAYASVLGPERHPSALGRPAREVWPELWDRLGPPLEQLLRHAEAIHNQDERFMLRRDGREVEVFFTYAFTPIQEEDGKVVGALNAFVETTARVRPLTERTALLHAISESSQDIIFAKDLHGRVLFANPAMLAAVDKAAEQVLGKTDLEFREDAQVARRLMDNDRWVMESGSASELEEQVPLPDGTRRVWHSLKTPYRDEGGRIIGLLGISRDITDRARADQALREADRRKNEFLAVLSHELRNPLAPIRNSVYILERATPGGEQARRAMQVIERQGQLLARLVEDLLDVTRISRGKVSLQRERVDLNALARGTFEDHREAFSSSGIELELQQAEEPLYVWGDPARLAQVIGNLLSNSAKFTPRGGKTVLRVGADERGEAEIRVRDNGAGMSPETLEHLFEPFMQAAQTSARTRGGLGLGLALVKGLVEMHGGKVQAHSEGEGRGSELCFTLPLLSAEKVTPAAVSAPSRTARARRVLVVEDNTDAAETLRDILDLGGNEVAIAFTGPEGLALAHTFKPDVVLSDIGLPGMDGYGVARALRADPELRSTYLVALSGYAQPEDLLRSKEAGFDCHMSKPASLDALQKLIADAPLLERPAPGDVHAAPSG